MSRIRTIKPEWCDSEHLAAMSDAARVMSVGLITLADDYGNGRGNLLYIAARIWPYEEDHAVLVGKASGALQELSGESPEKIREFPGNGAEPFARLYRVGGQQYFHITGWERHQRINKPGKPRVPGPEKAEENHPKVTDSGNPPKKSGNSRVSLPTDHDLDLDLDPDLDHEHDREGESEGEPSAAPPHGGSPVAADVDPRVCSACGEIDISPGCYCPYCGGLSHRPATEAPPFDDVPDRCPECRSDDTHDLGRGWRCGACGSAGRYKRPPPFDFEAAAAQGWQSAQKLSEEAGEDLDAIVAAAGENIHDPNEPGPPCISCGVPLPPGTIDMPCETCIPRTQPSPLEQTPPRSMSPIRWPSNECLPGGTNPPPSPTKYPSTNRGPCIGSGDVGEGGTTQAPQPGRVTAEVGGSEARIAPRSAPRSPTAEGTFTGDEPFSPDWTSPPGDTILDILAERGISIADFSRSLGIDLPKTRSLLDGRLHITIGIAQKLSKTLGASVEFWMNRERHYRSPGDEPKEKRCQKRSPPPSHCGTEPSERPPPTPTTAPRSLRHSLTATPPKTPQSGPTPPKSDASGKSKGLTPRREGRPPTPVISNPRSMRPKPASESAITSQTLSTQSAAVSPRSHGSVNAGTISTQNTINSVDVDLGEKKPKPTSTQSQLFPTRKEVGECVTKSNGGNGGTTGHHGARAAAKPAKSAAKRSPGKTAKRPESALRNSTSKATASPKKPSKAELRRQVIETEITQLSKRYAHFSSLLTVCREGSIDPPFAWRNALARMEKYNLDAVIAAMITFRDKYRGGPYGGAYLAAIAQSHHKAPKGSRCTSTARGVQPKRREGEPTTDDLTTRGFGQKERVA